MAQLAGVFLFLGGALFRRLIWNALSADVDENLNFAVEQRSKWLMISGATIFLVATLSGMRAGWISILPAALAPVFVAAFLASEARDSRVLRYLTTLAGLIIIGSLTAASHAADEPGLLPIVSSFVHWLAVLAWGGCLIYIALLPWRAIYQASEQDSTNIGHIVARYANLEIIALGLALLSGGLLAFIHVHNPDAMSTTDYGQIVTLKGAMIAVLLITVTINLLKLTQSTISRFRAVAAIETILLAGLIVSSGMLVSREPPGVAPFVNPQSWQMSAGETALTIALQPVSGSSTQVRIEISSASPDYRFPEGTLAYFDIYTPERNAGAYDIEAVPIGPSGFLGETILAIPGEWRFELHIEAADGTVSSGESILRLPALPLKEDLKPFLSLSAISFSMPGLITFVVGILLLLSAAWLLRQCRHGKAPAWIMPPGMASMAFGAYLALSVTFVKTYPSTFWNNPEPYTTENIYEGDNIYRAQCAECHGLAGKGDGPWAIEERGSIPDLSAPHMDIHTDGEIFWWITKGIPSLDQPALGEELSESERWTVINYVRSLRHGVPPE